MIDVAVKTLAKMSDEGRALALTIPFSEATAAFVAEALAKHSQQNP